MSEALDLLNSMSEDEIAAYVATPETEPHIVVGADRKVIVPDELKQIAVQYDHNIETVTFDCIRYWDGHDLSQLKLYISYLRADNTPDAYPIETVTIDDTDESIMHFDWTISQSVTLANGQIVFSVYADTTDEDGNLVQAWNSLPCMDMFIAKGNGRVGPMLETPSDVLTHILALNEVTPQRAAVYVGTGPAPEWADVHIDPTGEVPEGGTGAAGVGIESITYDASDEDGGTNILNIELTDGTAQGFSIMNGSKGSTGARGPQGESISHRWIGTQLEITEGDKVTLTDLQGPQGIQGETGATGPQGIQGEKGETGATGPQGPQGIQGEKGETGATGKSAYEYAQESGYTGTEAEFSAQLKLLMGYSIYGYVDENSNIILRGNIVEDSYTVKYIKEDGSTIDIGSLVLDNNVYYSVTNDLTNCTSDNDVSQATGGGSYTAVISANSGFELSSVTVTMGGEDITESAVSSGNINIESVTGDIVITAVATEKEVVEPVTVDIELTNGVRVGSDGTDREQAGYCATPHIDLTNIPKPCVIYLTGAKWDTTDGSTGSVTCYATKADGTKLFGGYTSESIGNGYCTLVRNATDGTDISVTITSDTIATIRFCGWYTYGSVNTVDAKATLTYTPAS